MSVCVWIGVVQEEESTPLELLQRIHEYLFIVCVVQEEESTPAGAVAADP